MNGSSSARYLKDNTDDYILWEDIDWLEHVIQNAFQIVDAKSETEYLRRELEERKNMRQGVLDLVPLGVYI